MTKEEILAAAGFPNTPAGIAAFYRKYPKQNDWKKEMAYGGTPYNPGNPFGAGIMLAYGGMYKPGGSYGTDVYAEKKMSPAQWKEFNTQRGYNEITSLASGTNPNRYGEFYNPKEYQQDESGTFSKIGAPEGYDYNKDASYKPIVSYGYKDPAPVNVKPSKSYIEPTIDRRQIDRNSNYTTYQYPDPTAGYSKAQTKYFDNITGQPIADISKAFDQQGKYVGSPQPVANITPSNAVPTVNKLGGTPYYGGPIYPAAYGGDVAEYCWGGLPGGANEMKRMDYGGYNSPTNYGSFSVPMDMGGNYKMGGLTKYQERGEVVNDFVPMPESDSLAVTKYINSPAYKSQFNDANYNLDLDIGKKYDVLSKINKKTGKSTEVTGWKTDLAKRAAYHEKLVNQQMNEGVPVTGRPYFTKTYQKVKAYKPTKQKFGGAYDPTNADSYPMMNAGGYGWVKDAIASVDRMRKEGGDLTEQGGNEDFITERNEYVKNYIKNMVDRSVRRETSKKVQDAFIQMDSQLPPIPGATMAYGGSYQVGGGPGIRYNQQPYDQINYENQARGMAAQNALNKQDSNLKESWNKLAGSFGANSYDANNFYDEGGPSKDETWEQYQERLREEKATKEGGKGRVWDGSKWITVKGDEKTTAPQTGAWANLAKAFSPEGMYSKWIPDNDIRTGYRLGKSDFAEMSKLDPNNTQIGSVRFDYKGLGKFMPRIVGPSSVTLGTLDMSKGAFQDLKKPFEFDMDSGKKGRGKKSPMTSTEPPVTNIAKGAYDNPSEGMEYGELFPKGVYAPGMSPADMMSANLYRQPSKPVQSGPIQKPENTAWDDMMNANQNRIPMQNYKAYGGLFRAKPGVSTPVSYDDWENSLKFTPPAIDDSNDTEEMPPSNVQANTNQAIDPNDAEAIQKQRQLNEDMFGKPKDEKPDIMGAPGKEYTAKKKITGVGKALAKRSALIANMASTALENRQSSAQDRQRNMSFAMNTFKAKPLSAKNKGDYDINSGILRSDDYVDGMQAQYGGFNTMADGGIPMALSGLEVKMQPGLYGTNGNRQFNRSASLEAGKISQKPISTREFITAVPRELANLEAEGGETAVVNVDGMPAHFKISGPRHSKGGVPLNLPDNSFIFSDTAKMKIKDPVILAQFGMVPKKGGYTPAEIAKKYAINKFRKVLADPDSETMEKKTAEMMIANYNLKLAKLAMIQESMKGFPQGIPVIAMPYIETMQIDPAEYIGAEAEEQMEGAAQPDAETGEARYGANIISQWDTKRYGGLPKAQTAFQVPPTVDSVPRFNPNWVAEQLAAEQLAAEQQGTITTGTPSPGGLMAAPTMSLKSPKVSEEGMLATEEAPEGKVSNFIFEALATPQKLMMAAGTGAFGDTYYEMVNPTTGGIEYIHPDNVASKAAQQYTMTGKTKGTFYETPGETLGRAYPGKFSKATRDAATMFLDPGLAFGIGKSVTRIGRLPLSTTLATEGYKNAKKFIKATKAKPGSLASKADFPTYLPPAKVESILKQTIGSKKIAKMSEKQIAREKALIQDGYETALDKASVLLEKQPKYLKEKANAITRITSHTNKAVSKQAMMNVRPGEKLTQAAEFVKEKIIDPSVKWAKKYIPDIDEAVYNVQKYSHAATPLRTSGIKALAQDTGDENEGPKIQKSSKFGADGLPLYTHRDRPDEYFYLTKTKAGQDSLAPYNSQMGLYSGNIKAKTQNKADTVSVLQPPRIKADTTSKVTPVQGDW